jgi:MFS family permease
MVRLVRQRAFGLLFAAQLVSLLGDFVLFVALPFWVYELTGSATATGLVFAASTLPRLLFSPIAGVFVDRWDRRRTMIAADHVLLPLLLVNSADAVWLVGVVAFAQSCAARFFGPAQAALLPTIVAAEDLTAANAAMRATRGSGWPSGAARCGGAGDAARRRVDAPGASSLRARVDVRRAQVAG